ncbi:MAG: hypothetical protein HN600_12750, partial [Bacteroidetes bacterium]|nr:hypothetical protein [Bacteroidota bacterium]
MNFRIKYIFIFLFASALFVISCEKDRPTEPTTDSCTDYDGNIYETVQLGDQLWMAENLKVTHYNNGDSIPTGFTNTEWSNLDDTETGAFTIYPYDNDDASLETCDENCAEVYGILYNWYTVDDDRGVCPEGFHVPSDEEWMELEMFFGMSFEDAHDAGYRGTDQGIQLAGNTDLWHSGLLEDNLAFGTSGFDALPGGHRIYYNGYYGYMGYSGYFWSSS